MNEKIKSLRSEVARKDQHIKDYKERMEFIQSEVTGRDDLQNELSKLRDMNRKQKLDLEVKENQVRTLRGRIDANHTQMQTMSDEKSNLMAQDNELGQKLRSQKLKSKRYETNLLKSMTALKKIGVELAALQGHRH